MIDLIECKMVMLMVCKRFKNSMEYARSASLC